MSATDELHRLLTESGIEWRYADERTTYWYGTLDGREWGEWTAVEHGGLLHVTFDSGDFVTPEQAIAATLGTGTCHITVQDNIAETDGMGDVWLECDKCHWQMPLEPSTPRFNFCPNCGARIEVD